VEHLNKAYSIHEGEIKATPGWSTGNMKFLAIILAVGRSIWQAWRDLSVHSEGEKTAMPLNFFMGTLMMLRYLLDVFMK
jgi:hypothetical protein